MEVKLINLGKEKFAKIGSRLVYFKNEALLRQEVKTCFDMGIYDFEAESQAPFVIDLGDDEGLRTLYIKEKYPKAKIVSIYSGKKNDLFERNIQANHLDSVRRIYSPSQDVAKHLLPLLNHPIALLSLVLSLEEWVIVDALMSKLSLIKNIVFRVESLQISDAIQERIVEKFTVDSFYDSDLNRYFVRAKQK